MQKNDLVTVAIEDIGVGGEGIGKVDGYTLFIKDAIIGDVVDAKIVKAKKNYGYARLMNIVTLSENRVEKPACPMARRCGGCQIQEMKYGAQLAFKEGKVREIYDNGDSLIMVATDRISCFDVILDNVISKKGTVLTQMSKFWFDMTQDILPNHMISVDVKDMPEFFQQEKFDGNSMMCRKLEMLPIECIVRGYITGSGWASYKENGTVCGIKLPEGLKESDKLPEPIYTPSTKAEIGDHDENISYEQSIAHLEKYFPGKGEEYASKLKEYTITLYKKCAEYALTRGIIIADTKFEFGLDENGNIVLGDEMLTPDSSRFWPADVYEPGHGQPSFDKQFARDWLKANPDKGWKLPDDVAQKTIDIYLEGYEKLTGKPLGK